MKKIFIIGAGLSSSTLIKYLLDLSATYDWHILLGDLSKELAESKIKGHPRGKAIKFDINNDGQREELIKQSDVVISMLPARMHFVVARSCVNHNKHMLTASYVSEEIRGLHAEAKEKGLLMLNEIGVDPGIDHMSAMKIIDAVKNSGGKMLAFRSYTGGLVAPKYDNNPWNYKFTWNPRNVVLAGQGTAQLIVNKKYKYIPYHKLFSRVARVDVLDYGEFEVYPNRDSLKYREAYSLQDIPTLIRGTMRRPGFCKTWDVFVQLGATDDTYRLENSEDMTYRDFINTFLKYAPHKSVEEKLADYVGIREDSDIMYRLRWLGLFKNKKIGLKNATPAQVLQHLLQEKWKLEEGDKDMIAMQHIFDYELNSKKKRITSSMVVEGRDTEHTAMSITVGVPVAIATKLLLTGKLKATGVQIPIVASIYEPLLEELKNYGIKFIDEEEDLSEQ